MEKSIKQNAEQQQKESSTGLSKLTDYHWKRRKDAGEAVKLMQQRPLSLKEIEAQIQKDIEVNRKY